jgi:hypothetical protein
MNHATARNFEFNVVILAEDWNISRDCNLVLYVCVASNNETEQTGAAELFAAAELHYFNQTEI